MTEKLSLEKLLKEQIGIGRVFADLIENTEKGKKLFFDASTIEDKEKQHTFCPYPTHAVEQTQGSSFYLHRQKGAVCYGGCTPNRLSYIDLVKTFIADVTPQDISDKNSISNSAYPVAVKYLVNQYGKELAIELTDVLPEKEKDVRMEIIRETVDYYHFYATKNDWGKEILEKFYKETRHFKYLGEDFNFEQFVKENKLGFAPYGKDNDRLYKKLKNKFSDEDIVQSGVCYLNAKNEIKDSFTNYAIVPYLKNGKPYSFMGRAIGDVEEGYRHKRLAGEMPHIAGFDDVMKVNEFYVVEGENTKLAAKALGYPTMETRGVNGLFNEHVQEIAQLKRVHKEPGKHIANLVLDPDGPGKANTLKVGEKFANNGFLVYVITMPILKKQLPDGEIVDWNIDVNDMLYAYQHTSKAAFESFRQQRMSFEVFKVLDQIKSAQITDLASANFVFKSLRKTLNAVPIFERITLVEELIPNIISLFTNRGLTFNEEMLRQALVDNYAFDSEVQPVQEEVKAVVEVKQTVQAKPQEPTFVIDGLERAANCNATMFIITDDKVIYDKCVASLPYMVLTNDLNKAITECRKHITTILIDSKMLVNGVSVDKSNLFTVDIVETAGMIDFLNVTPITIN